MGEAKRKKEYLEKKEAERIRENREQDRPDCYTKNHCVYIFPDDGFEECIKVCPHFTAWTKK